ncbi:hypothetical protein L1987_23791 [Smallanthus sonchifolius]|uniref:Uncharacterized protein n=1 Tax=Smallanthus sonchifolius TaxID=185202 RepID=A0ACB9IIN1_9ASTR|nr:hypothetical protein L1987_23791 [Smallanthus sonchifolius]
MATKVQTKAYFLGSMMDLNNGLCNELLRLYKRQKDLMNELAMKEHCKFTVLVAVTNSSHFLSQISSKSSKEMHTQTRVNDLELSADVDEDNERNKPLKNVRNLSTKRAYNLADLN